MEKQLAGKVALITGSTSNIGAAIAVAFGAAGARVVVTGRDADRGAAVADEIAAAGGQAHFLCHELDGSRARTEDLAAAAAAVYGPIEILVNSAAIYPASGTLSVDEATFDRILAVNVKVPFFLAAALVPAMAATGGGVIINLSSWGARLALPGTPVYASSKGAIETLTRTWAAEFAPHRIRVNAISPGVTFPADAAVADAMTPLMATTPLGALVDPGAVAKAAVFLASDDAAAIHGTVMDVDGGRAAVLFSAR